MSVLLAATEKVRPPRAVVVRWPFGHPLGEPFNHAQQMTVIHEALTALYGMEPGTVTTLPYRWRREHYAEPLTWPGPRDSHRPDGGRGQPPRRR